jgi:plasmid stabilization system protein ParE
MAQRNIVWTTTAVAQRRIILKYWTKRNGSTKYAEKLIKLISKHTSIIAKFPDSFKSTNFPGTRISSLGYYSILYKYNQENIIVTAFWDNRQDPKKLLKDLKTE